MIKAIIFDCFGVLTTDKWREFSASLDTADLRRQASEFNQAYDAQNLSRDQFLQAVAKLTGKNIKDIAATIDNDAVKNTDLFQYMRQLKAHYKLGLLSNIGSNWIRDYFLTPKELTLFDDLVLSFEVGMTKPDPRIFKLAAKRLGVEPSEVVFVDDIDRYAAAAEDVGMKGLVYHNFKQLKQQLEAILAKDSSRF